MTCRAILLLAFAFPAIADVQLPAILADHMVLQQGLPVHIWGKAAPGEDVAVKLLGQTARTKTLQDGKWQVFLDPLNAGGPYDITVTGANTITLKDVLVGEVWVASGQSNMAWRLAQSTNAEKEIADANYPQIRFFYVKTLSTPEPQEDTPGAEWKICEPANAGAFSGVGYFFARHLYQQRHVPIGILQSAVGGTPAQAWTSKETLQGNPALGWYLERWSQVQVDYPAAKEKFERALADWNKTAEQAKKEGRQPGPQPRPPMGSPGHTHTPSGLYNAMIAPIAPYGIKGVIWYQGESNAGPRDNELYRVLFSEMIRDWRRTWGVGPFTFLWVQLAGFQTPPDPQWPILRDSQTATLELKNTGQALAIDVGEPTDIHPKDKLTVGNRLALAARAVAYNENIVYSGPQFRQVTREGSLMRLWFDHAGSGLAAKDGAQLLGFKIAAADQTFVDAEARVEGNTVVVSNPAITNPAAVRYAWQGYPTANLVNREGLPGVPFRTDNWQ